MTNSQSFCISFAMMGYADAVRCGGLTLQLSAGRGRTG
jgi:hypothetical protein